MSLYLLLRSYLVNWHNASLCSTIFIFFFSSRRRHTRLVSDWSSDVCSSDLISPICDGQSPHGFLKPHGQQLSQYHEEGHLRSEEHRVGKECRFRWSQ